MAAVAPPPDNLDPPPSTPPSAAPAAALTPAPTATSTPPNPATPSPTAPSPNPNALPAPVSTPPAVVPPPMPPAPISVTTSFRPLGAPPPPPPHQVPQYGAVPPNPGYPMAQPMQPPGVPGVMPLGAVRPPAMYARPPQPGAYLPRAGATVPHPGLPRYPAPYPMVRPGYYPCPMPLPGVVPIQRPPIIPGIRGVPPVVAPAARPPASAVTPADKPPTAVYVGKIAPTVDNDFLLSLLRLCGPIKSWKRAQDPSNGKPKGFGFCEFESAEGILRAARLLNKLSIDGQELVININDATKEYLKKHVEEKKKAQEKAKETEDGGGEGTVAVADAENESSKPVSDESDKDKGDAGEKDSEENTKRFGIVTDEDSEADKDAAEKLRSMIEEWLKTRPPPPPPPVQRSADSSGVNLTKTDSVDKNDADTDKRAVNETGSPDRRKDRERDKDKRDKELERFEREHERERVRRDRQKDQKHREVERFYRDRLKEWESREREKEYQRQHEKDREKEKERERRREIMKQEDESDEEDNRKRKQRSSSTLEERKRRRQREKEEDLADKVREEKEIAEARRQAVELQRQADEAAAAAAVAAAASAVAAAAAATAESATLMEVDGDDETEENAQGKPIVLEVDNIASFANGAGAGDEIHKDNNADETSMTPGHISDTKQNSNAPTKKLGFGLIGSGKRTSVPSVFAEEDDENNDDKRIRPLVPIDYSTEELQAVPANSSTGPNIVAAAEFAKRISVSNSKEEKTEIERDRSRRSSDRSIQRDDEDVARVNDERSEKMHDREKDKPKSKNKKILDAKQLIDMIPKTKEELFAFDINWAIYDKHELHERMRPWISRKIIEFLGEEESTLVDYIVSCTKDHVQAEKMLELLQSILDVEAEMFVLKMWRMLIFEIKKVESGLSGRTRA